MPYVTVTYWRHARVPSASESVKKMALGVVTGCRMGMRIRTVTISGAHRVASAGAEIDVNEIVHSCIAPTLFGWLQMAEKASILCDVGGAVSGPLERAGARFFHRSANSA
jgi:hypothetical protein